MTNEVRKLWIQGEAGRLECALRVARTAKAAAVVAHPHPQHGGTLHNPVIFHSDRELHRLGWTTLRFNFRGIGDSEGVYDEGRGEVDDVAAAASWLRGIAIGRPIYLVGFSFGSWCSVRHALSDSSVRGVIAIGFPVNKYDMTEPLGRVQQPMAVVQADQDEFGTPSEVEQTFARANKAVDLRVVPDTTHLFPKRAADAAAEVAAAAEAMFRLEHSER